MSVESLSTVLHHSKAKGTTKLVLVGIANHDGDGGAWPSVGTLMRYTNAGRRTVQDALRALQGLGEIRVHAQAGGTADDRRHWSQRPNRYDVLVECPEGCSGGTKHKPRPGWEITKEGDYAPVDNPDGEGVRWTAPGAVDRTRGGATDRTLTVPSTGSDNHPSASVTGGTRKAEIRAEVQAGAEWPPSGLCAVCGNGYDKCQSVQVAWSPEDRHEFTRPTDLAPRRPAADRDRARDQRTADRAEDDGEGI